MKYTEGFWLTSERAKISYASDAYEIEKIPGGMRVLAPTRKINGRGDTLNLPVITIEFKAAGRNVISVRAWHYEAYASNEARFSLNEGVGHPDLDVLHVGVGGLEAVVVQVELVL